MFYFSLMVNNKLITVHVYQYINNPLSLASPDGNKRLHAVENLKVLAVFVLESINAAAVARLFLPLANAAVSHLKMASG